MEMRLGYWLDISHLPSRHWLQDRGELEFRAGIFCHLLGLSKLLGLLWIFSNFTTAPGFFFLTTRKIGLGYAGLSVFPGTKSACQPPCGSGSWESFPSIVGGVA